MADENQPHQAGDGAVQLEAEVRRAVEQGLNVQDRVRQLMLQQIGSGRFDLAALRELSQAVLNGALAGAQSALRPALAQTQQARTMLQQAVGGLDGALAQLAQTASLALQEAAGKVHTFSESDLARARADLASLESMFLDTLQATAGSTRDAAGHILAELAGHARRNGSAVGAELQDTLAATARQFGEAGRAQVDAGLKIAQAGTDLLRQIASGVLGGLAEQVKPAPRTGEGGKGDQGA